MGRRRLCPGLRLRFCIGRYGILIWNWSVHIMLAGYNPSSVVDEVDAVPCGPILRESASGFFLANTDQSGVLCALWHSDLVPR